ncbi:MAG TPA: zinc ribbon domain-containing protein, partial [Ktedonobacteraceae bacterium]|nr:zinc ribbon domain-containing protein [Ktedonobacteraceae bacterium]HVB25613.1 zinc ribbon domain-containing protein [Ktedonobacteraceae bacterium]
VNPRYTSQACSGCGTVRKKELSERWHSCECGTELDRDHNAAVNILRLGRSQQAS